MKLSIIIPAFNEERTIGKVIDGVKNYISSIVVNDGSKDKTGLIAKKRGCVLVNHKVNLGLGRTIKDGFKKALELKADIVLQIDADGQYVAKEIPKLLRPVVNEEADLVLGSRFAGYIEEMPFLNRFGNKAFTKLVSLITKTKITDAQTGFRVMTCELLKSINLGGHYTYTKEMIIKAAAKGFKILEVPIRFNKRPDGKSRLIKHPFKYAKNVFFILLYTLRDLHPIKFFGITGLLSILVGLFIGLLLIQQFLVQGFISSVAKPVLSALFLLFGVQMIFFGLLADMNKRK